MGISGSTLAPTQARFGIARYGATRYGYYFPYLYLMVNGTNQSRRVILSSLTILDRLNEQPNTASATFREAAAPVEGQSFIVALGNATDTTRLFGGVITSVTQRQEQKSREVLFDIEAVDDSWFLDRRLVIADYTSQSASAIVLDLVASFVTGSMTVAHVQGGLATIDDVSFTNVRPSTALTRLANMLDPPAQWYIDEFNDLHFFTSETTIPNPPTLISTNTAFWDLQAMTDLSQVRTRARVEGQRTTCPISFSAADWPSLLYGAFEIPVKSGDPFELTAGTARLGSQLFSHTGLSFKLAQGANPLSTVTTAAAVAGATSIQMLATGAPTTWCRIGDQYIYFGATDAGPFRLINIPASGPGSIVGDIASGSQIEFLPVLYGIPSSGAGSLVRDESSDTDIVMYVQVDDAAAQTALAAVEGGDGIHEFLVQDGRLNTDGATARANAELAIFGAAIESIAYKTRDTSTRAGRAVAVSLASPTSISGTFLIRQVTIRGFDELGARTAHSARAFPIREVEATPVRLGGFLDQLSSGEDGR